MKNDNFQLIKSLRQSPDRLAVSDKTNEVFFALCEAAIFKGDSAQLQNALDQAGFLPLAPKNEAQLILCAALRRDLPCFQTLCDRMRSLNEIDCLLASEGARNPLFGCAGARGHDSRSQTALQGNGPASAALAADFPDALAYALDGEAKDKIAKARSACASTPLARNNFTYIEPAFWTLAFDAPNCLCRLLEDEFFRSPHENEGAGWLIDKDAQGSGRSFAFGSSWEIGSHGQPEFFKCAGLEPPWNELRLDLPAYVFERAVEEILSGGDERWQNAFRELLGHPGLRESTAGPDKAGLAWRMVAVFFDKDAGSFAAKAPDAARFLYDCASSFPFSKRKAPAAYKSAYKHAKDHFYLPKAASAVFEALDLLLAVQGPKEPPKAPPKPSL